MMAIQDKTGLWELPGGSLRILFTTLTLLICLGLGAKTFLREYTYKAGEADSKISARAIALEQVKRLLLEEVGVYIQSSITNQDSEINGNVTSLTATDIQVLSAGITQTKVLDESWDGASYWLKAEIKLDEKDVLKQLDNLINNEKSKQAVEDSRETTNNALAEIDRLRQELEQEKDKNARIELQKAYDAETDKLTASDWQDKGNEALNNSDYRQASVYYQKAVELDPSNRDIWFNYGFANDLNTDYGTAIIAYQKCIDLDSLFVPVRELLGRVFLDKQDYVAAGEQFEKALQIDSTYTDAYISLGEVYRGEEDYTRSVVFYQKALQVNPTSITAYMGLIDTYKSMDDMDKVIDCYEQMLTFDEEPSYEAQCLAQIYEERKDYPNTIKYYNLYLQSVPDDYLDLMYLGEAYANNGQYNEAIACYLKALVNDPDNIWTLNDLGSAYYAMNDRENGNKYYIQSARNGDTDIRKWCDDNGIKWQE